MTCPNAVSSRVIHLVFHRHQYNCSSSLDSIKLVYQHPLERPSAATDTSIFWSEAEIHRFSITFPIFLALSSPVHILSKAFSNPSESLNIASVMPRKPRKELMEKQVCWPRWYAAIRSGLRQFPDQTLQSLKENLFTKQGGQPRRRRRKSGVMVGVLKYRCNKLPLS
jgi:hypothetical protein